METEPTAKPTAKPTDETTELNNAAPVDGAELGGRRKRKNGSRKNSWLAHVKATMKVNRNMSFKQVLKRAKQTYKRSKSKSQSSQNGGRRRRGVKRGGNSQQQQQQEQKQQQQQGGSGMAGKAPFGESAAPVA